MVFAVLDLGDFAIIAMLVSFAGGGAAATSRLWLGDRERLTRIEHKLDLILTHLDIDYRPDPKAAWQELADDPGRKIAAIKAYRQNYGTGLAESKRAVEEYLEGRDSRA